MIGNIDELRCSAGKRIEGFGVYAVIVMMLLALVLSACVRDEAPLDASSANPTATTPPGSSPPGNTPPVTPPPSDDPPPPVDPDPPVTPPPMTDVATFGQTLHPLLRDPANFCVGCHGEAQIPTFAVEDVMAAYNIIISQQKVNLDNPDLSRVYLRPAVDRHNCGGDATCDSVAASFLAAIQDWAQQRPPPDPSSQILMSSKTSLAAGMASGIVRAEANQIALFDFDEGVGDVTLDTSNVGTPITLQITNMEWVDGGLRNVLGKAEASVADSQKLFDLITPLGAYSIEAWLIPENTAQDGPARIVSYSSSTAERNFTLGQNGIYYNFRNRTLTSDANGTPALEAGVQDVATELQHVVITFDPAIGRTVYVNGQVSIEEAAPDDLDWSNNQVLVLGNEVTNNRPWSGVLEMVAIHNAALTPAEIQQNLNAGIGDFVTLQFDVSGILGNAAHVELLASQLDDASYVFARPVFIGDTAGIQVKNVRIAVNDNVPVAAQVFRRIDMTVMQSNTQLSPLGAVIPIADGPETDQFHLEFEVLGGQFGEAEAIAAAAPPMPLPDVPEPALGLRSFSKINDTMSSLTGIPADAPSVDALYAQVRDSLPASDGILSFVAAHQVATQRLAIAYCGEIVSDGNACNSFFGSCSIAANDKAGIAATIYDRIVGVNLANQPDRTGTTDELVNVMDDLGCVNGCAGATAETALQASCAAVLSSAAVSIN